MKLHFESRSVAFNFWFKYLSKSEVFLNFYYQKIVEIGSEI